MFSNIDLLQTSIGLARSWVNFVEFFIIIIKHYLFKYNIHITLTENKFESVRSMFSEI